MRPGRLLASVLAPCLLAPAVLMTGGCADSVYYQTRYSPSTGADAYSFSERLFWTEDPEVYETPANPPALASGEVDDEHRSRIDCRKPGQAFKANRVAGGGGEEIRGRGDSGNLVVARMEDASLIGAPPGPAKNPPVAGWYDERGLGAREATGLIPVAAYDSRPRSMVGSGTGERPAEVLAGTHEEAGWCPPPR